MELRTQRLMFTLGGSLVLSLGILAACSSDSGFSALPGGNTAVDAGSTTKKDTGTADGPDDGEDQDSGTTDAGCSLLRSSARQYCFGARSDDAGSGCSVADPAAPTICCADEKIGTMFTPSKCAATTVTTEGYATGKCGFSETVDGGGREYHCLESRQCPDTAPQCCVIKGSGGNPTAAKDTQYPASCNQFYNSGSPAFVGGTRCESTCDTGELHLCGSDDDCGNGETCYFFNLSKHFTGVCKKTL